MSKDKRGISTRCVHSGDERDAMGALHAPLYNHSTFGFESTQELLDVIDGRKPGNLYTRYGQNPTIRATEAKLAAIEGGEGALLFSSGMAAASAGFLSFCQAGDHILVVGDVYGGTFALLEDHLSRLGITTTFILGSELDHLDASFRDNTRVVFFETPTNPRMEVFDVAAIAEAAHQKGSLVMVDNTFATPINQRPLTLGADLVMQSTTKYLGGHSDLTGGALIGATELLERVAPWRKNLGQMMAPEVAFLLARSLRTLAVRVRVQSESAAYIAQRLSEHPRIKSVNYPGLESHPQHQIAKTQMVGGFGGMLSFVVDGDAAQTSALVDNLKLFSIAPSLGGVESLVTQPLTTTHHGMDPAERARRGIVDGMVRLSIGLEEPEDLWADLEQALEAWA